MRVAALVLALGVGLASHVSAGQAPRPRATPQPPPAFSKVAEAYEQFLLGRQLAGDDNVSGAVAAYQRAMALDPASADIPAELATLYMREERADEAIAAAEQALKIDADNGDAHRVLGLVYASRADESLRSAARRRGADPEPDTNLPKAIDHLERAGVGRETDPNLRATLARLYLRSELYDKAIPLLRELVTQEPGWQEGRTMLAQAFAAADRDDDAIAWLQEAVQEDPLLFVTLADFYENKGNWKEAAAAYEQALAHTPRNADVAMRYASALLNIPGRDSSVKARDAARRVLDLRDDDPRAWYLLSQAERRLGNLEGAENAARRVISVSAESPWGYYALAEALSERKQYQAVIDALAGPVRDFRVRGNSDPIALRLLLPHLGFAYQELGRFVEAIEAFDEAHKLSPRDPTVTGYLIQANLSAKRYPAAVELARGALEDHPDDLHFSRLEARGLQQSGQTEAALKVLENVVEKQPDQPLAHVILAQGYSEAKRDAQAVKVLQDAHARFPTEAIISFELGAVFDKQKRFADAEAAFRQVLSRDPDNAQALNYLGYMLAERGERLDESVQYLKRALQIEPDNGSYLDSLGWAYFKGNKLDLAEDNLKRAADQLQTNSVVQDHYADLLFKLGRYNDAIAAWTRALAGDGDSIDRAQLESKIRSARQKLPKK